MLRLLTTPNEREWTAGERAAATALLPPADLDRSRRYRRWQDAQATLLGRLLLRRAIIDDDLDSGLLARIAIDAAGRPSLPVAIDFSISHAEGLVALATSGDGPVGIDVELLRPLDPDDLGPALTPWDRRRIAAASDPVAATLQCWTAKEAVVKAAGLGITIPELPVWEDGSMTCAGRTWWTASWRRPSHLLTLAHDRPFEPPGIDPVRLDALLAQI